jgi:hypothetical protein
MITSSHAAIVEYSDTVDYQSGTVPTDLTLGSLESDELVRLYDGFQSVSYQGQVVNSYLVHIDCVGNPYPDVVTLQGFIEFDKPIIEIIREESHLDATDDLFGPSTIYNSIRKYETSGPYVDIVNIIGGTKVEFTSYINSGIDEFRIIELAENAKNNITKNLVNGAEKIGICLSNSTLYQFEIVYGGPPALIIDSVPAEFEIVDCDNEDIGTIDYFAAGKGPKAKSATIITWLVPAGSSKLIVDIRTRESFGRGHKLTTYKPTSCGILAINDGAMAYQVDEFGNPILNEDNEMIPIKGLEYGSGRLEVEAVCGAKPCAPTGLKIYTGGTGELLLDWANVDCGDDPVSYNVYRKISSSEYLQVAGPLDNSEYIDSSLTSGTVYCYVIEAEYIPPVEGLESDKSEEVCETAP